MHRRLIAVCTIVTFSFLTLANLNAAQALGKSLIKKRRALISTSARSGHSKIAAARGSAACAPCARTAKGRAPKKVARTAKNLPCHPKNYVDPKIARNYKAALRDMRRAGIAPKITSAWRSSGDQARLRRCSLSARCRGANPGLYRALPPGKSLHEAGFAVDISGVATGPRGDKRMTPQGRRIVGIMRKNGFKWRYGLSDPAHFEADPKTYGYRSKQQAIARAQTTCQASLAKNKTHKKARNNVAVSHAPARAPLRAEARATKGTRRAKARV